MNILLAARSRIAMGVICCTAVHLAASAQSPQFAPDVPYAVGKSPHEVVVGDFNGDGIPDLATANSGDGTVSILLGTGHGAYMPAKSYPATALAGSIALGDFNGDGKLDLVVASYGMGKVGVMLGNGDGTFKPFVAADQADTIAAGDLLVGDFNGDGKSDFIIANRDDETADGPSPLQGISVYLGKGDGTFALKGHYGDGGGQYSIALGDFNGDGRPDFVATGLGTALYLGVGDGTFKIGTAPAEEPLPSGIGVGDFNGDGKQDVVEGNSVIGFGVSLGNGNDTFGPIIDGGTDALHNAAIEHPWRIISGDFDGDGKVDALFATVTGGLVLYPGNGDGTFGVPTAYVGGPGYAVADLNSDGALDAVATTAADNLVHVLLNVGNPSTPPTLLLSATDIPMGTTAVLTWKAFPAATACVASGAWSGVLATSGSKLVGPFKAGRYQFQLTCSGAGKSLSTGQSIAVYVPGTLSYESVGLNSADIDALTAPGAAASAGGLDGHGYAYSNQALPTTLTALQQTFDIGEAVSGTTIPLSGNLLANVTLLATAVNGNQLSQPFIITYSDGTTTLVKQSLSDWHHPQNFAGESTAAAMTYRISPTGAKESGVFDLYAYQIPVNGKKIPASLKLPANRDVVVLAVNETLAPKSVNDSLLSYYNVEAVASAGQPARNGGLDGHGNAYESDLVPPSFTWAGQQFRIGLPEQPSAVANSTIKLPAAQNVSLTILATGVNGNQPDQTFLVTYRDGSTTRFQQSISDWHHPQTYAGESIARSTGDRIAPTGARENGIWDLYAYTFQTDPNKPILSLTLPQNRNVVVLAVNSLTR